MEILLITNHGNIDNLNANLRMDICQYYEYSITSTLSITNCVNNIEFKFKQTNKKFPKVNVDVGKKVSS